jgi:hypothetical protein
LPGAGAADVFAGAGVVTTVGWGGVCWQPVINISPITAGARETIHLEEAESCRCPEHFGSRSTPAEDVPHARLVFLLNCFVLSRLRAAKI